MTERERFEAFHAFRKSKGAAYRDGLFARSLVEPDAYADESVQRHWWTWQSALAAQPVTAQGWRPIETAPRVGHVLLLVPTRWGKWAQAIAAEGEFDSGGFWVIFNADEAIQRVSPVGWQPLPQPPEAAPTPETVQDHRGPGIGGANLISPEAVSAVPGPAQAEPAASAGSAMFDSPQIDAMWQAFCRTHDYRQALEWGGRDEVPGALFVAFRQGLWAALHATPSPAPAVGPKCSVHGLCPDPKQCETEGRCIAQPQAPADGGQWQKDALQGLVDVIKAAGLLNLSNGVQLGQTVWYCKASDALAAAEAALAAPQQPGEQG